MNQIRWTYCCQHLEDGKRAVSTDTFGLFSAWMRSTALSRRQLVVRHRKDANLHLCLSTASVHLDSSHPVSNARPEVVNSGHTATMMFSLRLCSSISSWYARAAMMTGPIGSGLVEPVSDVSSSEFSGVSSCSDTSGVGYAATSISSSPEPKPDPDEVESSSKDILLTPQNSGRFGKRGRERER